MKHVDTVIYDTCFNVEDYRIGCHGIDRVTEGLLGTLT